MASLVLHLNGTSETFSQALNSPVLLLSSNKLAAIILFTHLIFVLMSLSNQITDFFLFFIKQVSKRWLSTLVQHYNKLKMKIF